MKQDTNGLFCPPESCKFIQGQINLNALKARSDRENDSNEVLCPPSWTAFAAVGGLLSQFYHHHSGHRVQIQDD